MVDKPPIYWLWDWWKLLGRWDFFYIFLRIYLIDKMYRVALLTDEFRLGFQQGWNWRVYRQVGRMAGQRSD